MKLSKKAIFKMIDKQYSDDQAEEKLEKLLEMGLSLEDIVKYALASE